GGNVVEVVVGIDNKLDRKTGECANRGKKLFPVFGAEITVSIDTCRCVDDDDSIVADDESRIRRAIRDRCPDIRADLLQRKQRLGNALSARLTAEAEKNNAEQLQEPRGS